MLQKLIIQNLAVVEDAVIPFGEGLNVLTGSTGAGKSIILTAVDLLSGSRARRSLLRRGTERLTVEGIFSVPPTWPLREDLGMEQDEELVSMKREFTAGGKSRIWINGTLTTIATAQETAQSLLELHGQHRQQELLDPAKHIVYLDTRGDYGELLDECMKKIERYKDLSDRLQHLVAEAEEHRKQEDYLRFQLRELDGLKLDPDTDKNLEKRIKRMENVHKFISSLEGARTLLSEEDGSILEKIAGVEMSIESLTPFDESWKEAISGLKETRISLQELVRAIGRSLGEIQEDPGDLEMLHERSAAIQRACRKHGLDYDGLLQRREEIQRILRSLTDGSDEIVETNREMKEVKRGLLPLLEDLSRRRKRSARALDREVTGELIKLGMKGALFQTDIDRLKNSTFTGTDDEIHLNPRGWDQVEFKIRTNVGETIHPLAEVASGGELSRITLVLKKLQIEEKGIPTLIFDEIDTGLGADLGAVVAERLSELAGRYQIVCITHLPQVAARASQHIMVKKRVRGGRTATSATVLTGAVRVVEIARMLGGKGKLREELATELLEGRKRARSSAG